jgi:hypothetical protein
MYSTMWGLAYATVRRLAPPAGRALGLPATAAAFFLACDGVISPTLALSPRLARLPRPINLKELLNHVAWNATAEALHRADERAFTRRAR